MWCQADATGFLLHVRDQLRRRWHAECLFVYVSWSLDLPLHLRMARQREREKQRVGAKVALLFKVLRYPEPPAAFGFTSFAEAGPFSVFPPYRVGHGYLRSKGKGDCSQRGRGCSQRLMDTSMHLFFQLPLQVRAILQISPRLQHLGPLATVGSLSSFGT